MDMKSTNHTPDLCNEPALATVADTLEHEEPGIPYEVDFGFPRTLDELKSELRESHAQRLDSSKWMSSDEFWTEMRRELPWL